MASGLPISIDATRLARICRAHGVIRLSLFGSVLRDDSRPDSDVDVLVERDPEARVGLMGLARLQSELEALFPRAVRVTTPNSLSRYFDEKVKSDALAVSRARHRPDRSVRVPA